MDQFKWMFDEDKDELPSFYMLDSKDGKMEFDTDKDTYYYQGKINSGILRIFVEGLPEDKECFYLLKGKETNATFRIIHPYEAKLDDDGILYRIDDETELVYTKDDDSEKILMVRITEKNDGIVLGLEIVNYTENYFANKRGFLYSISPDQFRNKGNKKLKAENGFFNLPSEKQENDGEVSALQRSYLDSMIRENRK